MRDTAQHGAGLEGLTGAQESLCRPSLTHRRGMAMPNLPAWTLAPQKHVGSHKQMEERDSVEVASQRVILSRRGVRLAGLFRG